MPARRCDRSSQALNRSVEAVSTWGGERKRLDPGRDDASGRVCTSLVEVAPLRPLMETRRHERERESGRGRRGPLPSLSKGERGSAETILRDHREWN